jgi:hypothetical protein
VFAVLRIDSGDSFDDQVFASNRSRLVETTDVDTTGERNSERFSAEDGYKLFTSLSNVSALIGGEERGRDSQYLLSATREALTAIESSIGSSGGTTEVMMMTQSNKSFERLRSCSTPEHCIQT